MLFSMTGFATARGEGLGYSWTWDLRSVNAKGLDLRLRVPDWVEGLEPALKARMSKALGRGSVTLSLRVSRDETEGRLVLNRAQLESVITAMSKVEVQAMDMGLALAPSRAADILSVRGVLETGNDEQDTGPLRQALVKEIDAVLDAFLDMRRSEGAALEQVLHGQLEQIETLTAQAADVAEERKQEVASNLRTNLARVLENSEGADEQRVAQELAMLAVKADVTEEIDRLGAHVGAARDLIASGGPVGRKLDFLMQEFNREANTLCSKSQNTNLTRIGLDLKAVIDQMREQVQNVE